MNTIGITTGNLKKNSTGMGTYSFQIIERLKPDFDIEIIKHPDGDPIDGCRIVDHNIIPGPYWYYSWSKSLTLAKRSLKKVDILHNIGQYPISPSISKKYAITIYDLIPILYPSYVTPFYAMQSRIYLPNILRKASLILSISEYTKKDIVGKYHVDPDKIHVTHLGVSDHFHPSTQSEIRSLRKKYNLINPFILFVGAIEPKKNISTIIKAYHKIRQKNSDIDLVIAGKKSWKYQEVFSLVDSLKLNENVHYLQFVPYEDLPILYSAASVFVFPSNYEGFGLPPLEAMKCGTPVIVSNKSSLPEIVGSEGIMVEPDNFEDLAVKIQTIFTDESIQDEHIMYNLTRSKEFTWERCANATKDAYNAIL
ncbi:glycosyltransferase family 4 protein [Methanospirillum lacunae]|uniref:Glycosyltransferase family 1 protein n=1 Tax=Methanospirillum lacunae TaxID=668570 RepID=A0A2V2N2P6_9EURY|nr:glycosyltransferase family 1 protein [Methanospirillum lacunae]PWR69741.1 glycosyltransferase family 1 protein [Methanospirillum lacunae]